MKNLMAAALLLLPAVTLAASGPTPDISELLRRIEAQEQRIAALERTVQQERESRARADAAPAFAGATLTSAAAPAAAPAAAVTPAASAPAVARVSPDGINLTSDDGANQLRLRGNLAVDGRWYSDQSSSESADTWLLRRVRPDIQGTLARYYDFRFMPDFGNGKTVIQDAWVSAHFQPWFALQAGKFKAPVGLERLQFEQFSRFLEVGLPSALLPYRDLGVQASGELAAGRLTYALGAFDGVADGTSTDANPNPDADSNDGRKDFAARLFARPFLGDGTAVSGLGVGIGGTWVNESGSPAASLLPTYRTPGQQIFFSYRSGANGSFADGRRYRLAPQFYYYAGSFGVLGEYALSSQEVTRQVGAALRHSAQLNNEAWQLAASWFLSGEREAYSGFAPLSTFEPGRSGWGAWEVVARWHELRVDPDAFSGGAASFADPRAAARAARALGIGANWYLNPNVKWMLDYERTRFSGGAPAGDRADESVLLTRFALVF